VLASRERAAQLQDEEEKTCRLELVRSDDDICITCDGSAQWFDDCEQTLLVYGFQRACSVRNALFVGSELHYVRTIMCRGSGGETAPLPCNSPQALVALSVELQYDDEKCAHAAKRPDEQCVRCNAAPERCQNLAEAGFSKRCAECFAPSGLFAELWCRKRTGATPVACATLARLIDNPETSNEQDQGDRKIAEESGSVAASYRPPKIGEYAPVPPRGPGCSRCSIGPATHGWPALGAFVLSLTVLGARRWAARSR